MNLASQDIRLLIVADRDYVGDDARWLDILERLGAAAPDRPLAIQVRMHGVEEHTRADLAMRARERVPHGVPLLLNGEASLAERLGYDGVHWREHAIPNTHSAQTMRYLTASVHSIEAIRRAEQAGVDTVLFGAVRAPGSHPGTGAGIDALREVARATDLEVIAIGGIQPEHVEECMRAGAAGVAVVSGILGADDVNAAIDRYLQAIEAAMEGIRA